jgi:hypothetical protein
VPDQSQLTFTVTECCVGLCAHEAAYIGPQMSSSVMLVYDCICTIKLVLDVDQSRCYKMAIFGNGLFLTSSNIVRLLLSNSALVVMLPRYWRSFGLRVVMSFAACAEVKAFEVRARSADLSRRTGTGFRLMMTASNSASHFCWVLAV